MSAKSDDSCIVCANKWNVFFVSFLTKQSFGFIENSIDIKKILDNCVEKKEKLFNDFWV